LLIILIYTLYFENFGLFSILYKFFRYNDRDVEDLKNMKIELKK